MQHKLQIRIPFPTARHASIACQVISVDKELKQDIVKRTLSTDGIFLVVDYECAYVKMLRTVATGFFENVLMVTRTIDAFDLNTDQDTIAKSSIS